MADYIPIEVVSQILSNLSTKKVVQCTVVCKSWYSLIKTPSFISTHLEKTLNNHEDDRNVYVVRHGVAKTLCSFDDKFLMHEHTGLEMDKSLLRHYSSGEFIGSCNGLVCFTLHSLVYSVNDYKVVLWNPFIRRSFVLPNATEISTLQSGFQGPAVRLGFGFESCGSDYKVLRVARFLDELRRTRFCFDLYSLNANSWRDITKSIGFNSDEIVPVGPLSFAEGYFHCFGYFPKETRIRLAILAFKAGGESFRVISLPETERLGVRISREGLIIKAYRPLSSVAVVERCVDRRSKRCWFNVWVMKEYGFEDTWCLLFKAGRVQDTFSQFLGFGINQETIYESDRTVVSYDPVSRRTKVFSIIYRRCYSIVDSYIPSLALLDKGK